MVESLREIEVAYSLLKDDSGSSEAESSVIDQHYAKLNTKIEPVDVDSDEFDILRKYVENTHAQTHSHYSLNIENVSLKFIKQYNRIHIFHCETLNESRITNILVMILG